MTSTNVPTTLARKNASDATRPPVDRLTGKKKKRMVIDIGAVDDDNDDDNDRRINLTRHTPHGSSSKRPRSLSWQLTREELVFLTNTVLYGHAPAPDSLVRLLVENGVDINAPDSNGVTPLMRAVINGDSWVVGYLLGKGANVHARHSDERTALCIAIDYNRDPLLICKLIEAGSPVNRECTKKRPYDCWPLGSVMDMRHDADCLAVLTHLVNHGVQLEQKDKGQTILIKTCLEGKLKRAEWLLEFGADVDARDNDGDTPLLNAIREEDMQMVNLLLTANADTTVVNRLGLTTLDVATALSRHYPHLLERLAMDPAKTRARQLKTK